MGTPLTGPALLRYLRRRLEDLDDAEEQMPAAWRDADPQSPAYQAGRLTGLASAYHDIEHVVRGDYGEKWGE